MLINIGNQEKEKYRALLKDGKVIQYWLDNAIQDTTKPYKLILPATNDDREWDNYIHPSYLDWGKPPAQQIEKLAAKGLAPTHISANRVFHLGNLVHAAAQHLIAQACDIAYPEIGLKLEKYHFKGTADFILYHRTLGWILLELKSYSELQRDKTTGDVLVKRLNDMLAQHKVDRTQYRPHASEYASSRANITYAQMAKIRERLLTCARDMSKPEREHLTQVFTYGWLIGKVGKAAQRKTVNGVEVIKFREVPRIDRVCVCYIGKGKFETVEHWYSVKRSQDLILKAEQNYKAVFKEARKRGFFS